MNNTLSLLALKSAEENRQIIVRGQAESHKLFIHMSVALFQVKAHKQWATLGYKNIEAFLDCQNVNIGKSQFHDMANLGRALQWINTTESELVSCGYSSCKEIARLAKSKGDAEINRETIADLITRRAKGLIDNASVRSEVVTALGLDKPKADKPGPVQNLEPSDDSGDDSSDDIVTTPDTAPDWRKQLLTELSRAIAKSSNRADAAALILDILAGE